MMEKLIKPVSGYLIAFLSFLTGVAGIFLMIWFFLQASEPGNAPYWMLILSIVLFATAVLMLMGLVIVQPNYAVVLSFFGKYVGSVRENGLQFVNPLYTKVAVSLRAQSIESNKLKVNDKLGNPIDIAAVIVWKISDTYKAVFQVTGFDEYLKNQSEAAVRHLATSYPYDNIEHEEAHITLRDGGQKVIELLEEELNERLEPAGITIMEARISHLAYASEIAGAMLQRQQATAIVAARTKIVEGAVSMVEMALHKLSERNIVSLDEEKKATMVSNLLVVLCSERSVSPVVNTGSIY
jgi:regulator of protease activity HflC (stomatin/prohibitin superfamily)